MNPNQSAIGNPQSAILRTVRWLCIVAFLISTERCITAFLRESMRCQIASIRSRDQVIIERYKRFHPSPDDPPLK